MNNIDMKLILGHLKFPMLSPCKCSNESKQIKPKPCSFFGQISKFQCKHCGYF